MLQIWAAVSSCSLGLACEELLDGCLVTTTQILHEHKTQHRCKKEKSVFTHSMTSCKLWDRQMKCRVSITCQLFGTCMCCWPLCIFWLSCDRWANCAPTWKPAALRASAVDSGQGAVSNLGWPGMTRAAMPRPGLRLINAGFPPFTPGKLSLGKMD